MDRIALVDLSEREVRVREPSKGERHFIGGKGLGFKILNDNLRKDLIVFASGPLTGLRMSGLSRCEAVFISPLTSFVADSSCGGFFGRELRRAGFLALILKGRSKSPVYVRVEDGEVEVRDADWLWGRDTFETEDLLKKELGKSYQIASIGQAGENLVRFACIEHAKGREFGRCGGGAVLGAMKVKAIAVKGSADLEETIANYERFNELREDFESRLDVLEGISRYGTPKMILLTNELKVLPTKYWRRGSFDSEIFDDVVRLYARKKSCFRCKVGCGKISKFNGKEVEGPEYETLFALGSLCGVRDARVIAEANLLCDKFGMDTISTGNVIAFLFYLSEKGLIDEKYEFGDRKAVLDLIRKIAFREGIGDGLAEGVRRFAESMGIEGVHVKGLEPPGYDPRGLMGMALAYAVSYRGACHIKHCIYRPNLSGGLDRFKPDKQAETLIELENFYGFTDCLVICRFLTLPEIGPLHEEDVAELYNAVTGQNLNVEDMLRIGGEVINLAREINVRLGLKREDDYLPEFFFKVPTENGVVDRKAFERMLEEYYRLRGWL